MAAAADDIKSARIGIGSAIDRVDGVEKVTGTARYAAEHPREGMLYGVVVSSAIARGEVRGIDDAAARAVPGVVDVMTHENRPASAWRDGSYQATLAPPGSPFRPLEGPDIQFSGQPLALVLAESFEAARYAAALVEIDYETMPHNTELTVAMEERFMPFRKRSFFTPPKDRGDAAAAYEAAPLKIASRYHVPTEHHNPMETHASTVVWEGDGRITVHDKTQGSQNVQGYLASALGFDEDEVRVLNPYVGGAFGSGLRPQYNVYLAAMAAKHLERSVRLVLTRQQMFTHVHRPESEQRVKLGTDRDGRLQAIVNDATTTTSRFEHNMENVVNWGLMHYACPNASADYAIAPRDTYTSSDMRAPGAANGMSFFEMAIDEMAHEAGLDPLEFRLLNDSDVDAMAGHPFTSKSLREAYAAGAEAFGWSRRSAEPRSMREGNELIGWGVAGAAWEALFMKHAARATLGANGQLEVACASSDIGTGTRTVMALVAADTLGLPPEDIVATLGDSDLPTAPVEGGSYGAASVGTAVRAACRALAQKLLDAAGKVDGRPLGRAGIDDVRFEGGEIVLKADAAKRVPLVAAMRAAKHDSLEAEETVGPGIGGTISMMRKSRNAHGATFVEVRVDEELGVVRVTRVVSAVAAGRILSPKTARSQILGGVVWGVGMALHEESLLDHRIGRFMNHNLAEYHVPVNADIGDIEVLFVDERDDEVNPIGVKGLGEIGIVGTAGAVANATFHATGKRVRELPITIDKVFG